MSENASTTQQEQEQVIATSRIVQIHGVTTEIHMLPADTQLEDGQHFLSPKGNHCYKVPREHYQLAVKYVNSSALGALAKFTSEQLNQVLIWTKLRLADKGKDNTTYLILPVSKEKAKQSLSMYMKGLWALRKGAQAELATRDAVFFTPVPKVVAAPAATAAAVPASIETVLAAVEEADLDPLANVEL